MVQEAWAESGLGGETNDPSETETDAGLEKTAGFEYDEKTETREQSDERLVSEIREVGNLPEKACIHLLPTRMNTKKLFFDDVHINSNRDHNVTREQAERWIDNAKISITVWNGMYERYFSSEGAVYVNLVNHSVRTAYPASQYDARIAAIMEVLKGNGY